MQWLSLITDILLWNHYYLYKDNRHNDNDCPMIQQYLCTICVNWYRSERKWNCMPRINSLISCFFIKMAILTIKFLSHLLENYLIRQMSGRQTGIFTLGLKYRGFYTKYGKKKSCIMLLLWKTVGFRRQQIQSVEHLVPQSHLTQCNIIIYLHLLTTVPVIKQSLFKLWVY